jgi:PIN domain nuclease of toxin-antitoxin system
MDLLLDTHVILWALADDRRLGRAARKHIVAAKNNVFVSAVSLWEITLKRARGKLRIPDDLGEQLGLARFAELPLQWRHCQQLAELPRLHDDPFDRMLLAQALCDDLTLVTPDEKVLAYAANTLDAR